MRRIFELLESRVLLDGTGLIHTSHEVIPDYAADPDTVTIADGNWFDTAIWSNGVPTAQMDARIDHAIVIAPFRGTLKDNYNGDVPSAPAVIPHAVAEDINVYGKLFFHFKAYVSLTVTTMTVLENGILEVGKLGRPVTGSSEIFFRDAPFDFHFDPQQLGHGLIVIDNASLHVYGREATSFVEVAQAPRAGHTTLVLAEAPTGWLPGDELWIADTRHRETFSYGQNERLTIQSVNGNEVTLDRALVFDHFGNGDFLPHVAHLSGNVTFRSENPDGVRGHTLVTGRPDVRVHNAVFDEIGRTTSDRLDNTHLSPERHPLHIGQNQIGRYAMHLHHLFGPEGLPADVPQYELVGNRFTDGRRWAVAIHDTHYGLVEDNVIVNFQGAGIVFEDGSEFGNRVEGNFIGLLPGSGGDVQTRVGYVSDPLVAHLPRHDERITHVAGVLWGDGSPQNPYRTLGDLGHEGTGIWGRSASNHIVDNVVANAQIGNVLWTRFFTPPPLPAFKGADPHENGIQGWRGRQYGHEFSGNEVYASTKGYNWLGVGQGQPSYGVPNTVFRAVNNDAWNIGYWIIDANYSGYVEFIGGTLIGGRTNSGGSRMGFMASLLLDGTRFQQMAVGITVAGPADVIRNCTFADMRIGVGDLSHTATLESNVFTNVVTQVL